MAAGAMAENTEPAPKDTGAAEEPDLAMSIDSYSTLADEASGSALLAGLVWVFALDWVSGYDPEVFKKRSWMEGGATADDPLSYDCPQDDRCYDKSLHGAFVTFIAIAVGAGGFGVIVLSIYFNMMKLIAFQTNKKGALNKHSVRQAAEAVVGMDPYAYMGRALGIWVAFPAFLVSGVCYFWARVRYNMFVTDEAAYDQAVAGVVLMSFFMFAAFGGGLMLMLKYAAFKSAIYGSDATANEWYKSAFE